MIDENKLLEAMRGEYCSYCKEGTCTGCYISAITELIITQPKVGEWIPVSERLPKYNEDVLVQCRTEQYAIGYFDKGGFHDGMNPPRVWIGRFGIIAWMPLPEPIRLEENDG